MHDILAATFLLTIDVLALQNVTQIMQKEASLLDIFNTLIPLGAK